MSSALSYWAFEASHLRSSDRFRRFVNQPILRVPPSLRFDALSPRRGLFPKLLESLGERKLCFFFAICEIALSRSLRHLKLKLQANLPTFAASLCCSFFSFLVQATAPTLKLDMQRHTSNVHPLLHVRNLQTVPLDLGFTVLHAQAAS